MIFRTMIVVSMLFFSSIQVLADECLKTWTYEHEGTDVVAISACKYASGKSGYYKIENLKSVPIKICWEIEYNNAEKYRKKKYCRTSKPGEVSKGSCFACNPVNGGVKVINVTKYEVK